MYTMSGLRTKKTILLISVCASLVLVGCTTSRPRRGGDYYTSDLINARVAIGPVGEARAVSPDVLGNRRIALTTEDIQTELSNGVSEIHRAASVVRIGGKGGADYSLQLARKQGAELVLVPRIEKLVLDDMGRNGFEPVAKGIDILLFPITLITAAVTQGKRGGWASDYLPIYEMMVTMKMSVDYYRVSDGQLLVRRTYPFYSHCKANRDNLEGARLDPTDDWRAFGREQGRFTVRSFGQEIAKFDIPEVMEKVSSPR